MHAAINSTSINLVPKIPHPRTMAAFRPISCCNTVYKCMPEVISSNQYSAFIEGRSITNNVLLAQELIKGHHRKSISARCTLKVDLRNAFDSVYWKFLNKS